MSDFYQALGTVCAGIAAFLFAVPLQHLLWEKSRKRDDGGGFIAGLIILVPMWLLLALALMFVIADGSFDWLGLTRIVAYLLSFAAMMSMAVVSFFFMFEPLRRTSLLQFLSALPIYLYPALTILLILFSLNPTWSIGGALDVIRRSWALIAAIHLAVGGAFVSCRLWRYVRRQVIGFTHNLGRNREVEQKNLLAIAELDPVRGFSELLSKMGGHNDVVRAAAMIQMRRHPDFIGALAQALQTGWSEPALDALEHATLNAEELEALASSVRVAIHRLTNETQSRFRYVRKDPRKKAVRVGRGKQIQALVERFKTIGVDLQPLRDTFDASFDNPEN